MLFYGITWGAAVLRPACVHPIHRVRAPSRRTVSKVLSSHDLTCSWENGTFNEALRRLKGPNRRRKLCCAWKSLNDDGGAVALAEPIRLL